MLEELDPEACDVPCPACGSQRTEFVEDDAGSADLECDNCETRFHALECEDCGYTWTVIWDDDVPLTEWRGVIN